MEHDTPIGQEQQHRNVAGAGPGTTTARDIANRGTEAYEQGKQFASQAYDRTAHALSGTYNQAMEYGRENPGKTVLIAFGVGLGIGMMLAGGRRSRVTRYGEPIVNALSDLALEFMRGR